MKKPFLFFGFIVLVVIVGIFAFRYSTPTTTQPTIISSKLRVLTTFLPIYVFTANVAGDRAEVTNLLPPGVGPHDYTFTPGDVQKIASADVIVMNGVNLESWMQDLVQKSGTHAVIIDASAGVQTKDGNPHIWLDPVRAEAMVQNIATGLTKADQGDAAAYAANTQMYTAKLAALDTEIKTALAKTPNKDFIAFHPAFGYLAERYGLNQRAVIEESPGKDPTAQYLASIIDLIKKDNVKALFSEPQFSPVIVQTIAQETSLTVRALDTAETGDFATDTYEKVMRSDLQILGEALSGK